MTEKVKELVLALLLVGTAVLLWFLVSLHAFKQPDFSALTLISFTVVVVFLLLYGVSAILTQRYAVFVITWAAASYASLIWFLGPVQIITASILFLFGSYGYWRTKREMEYILKGNLMRSLRRSLPLMVTFLALAVSSAVYTVNKNAEVEPEVILNRQVFNFILDKSSIVIDKLVMDFKPDMTFREFTLSRAVKEQPQIAELGNAEKDTIMELAVGEFNKKFNIEIGENNPMSDVIYQVSLSFLKRREKTLGFFAIVLSVSVFIALRIVMIPLVFLAILLVILALKLLLRMKVVQFKSVPTELIIYSF